MFIELDWDYLYVYDGPTESDPLLWVGSGTVAPPTMFSSGTSVLIVFISDVYVTDGGFLIDYMTW